VKAPALPSRLDIQIVSHATPELVETLLDDLAGVPAAVRVLENVAGVPLTRRPGVEAIAHADRRPRGYGENHNVLAGRGEAELIAILNPDLRLAPGVFEPLLAAFDDPRVGIVAPRVRGSDGRLADNARRILTPRRLLTDRLRPSRRRTDYPLDSVPCEPDWIAGMFMIVRRRMFEELGGFDAGYRMYCENMDLCVRAWLAGWTVRCLPSAAVRHAARRASRSDARHLGWHVRSLLRFWRSPAYRRFVAAPPVRDAALRAERVR